MKRFLFAIFLMCCCSVEAFAVHVAVLETTSDESAKEGVSLSDRQYLTNVLREQAVLELPAEQNYTIMTRENINAMLPPGKTIEECEGNCLAETGRNIAADFICQARVGRFGTKLTLTAELYETASNKLIASFNGRGSDVEELLELIKEKSPAFFRRVKELSGVASEPVAQEVKAPVEEKKDSVVVKKDPVEVKKDSVQKKADTAYVDFNGDLGWDDAKVSESVPANVEGQSSKSIARWVVLGVGAAASVTGVVLAIVGNSKAKHAAEEDFYTQSEKDDLMDDVKSAQRLRAVGIGIAIAGAVGIGLSFAF